MKIGIIGAQIEAIDPILQKLIRVKQSTQVNQEFFIEQWLQHDIIQTDYST